ncbi:ATP-binding protein [Candidatus Roizmanbacteria bacterium]|nr:ATP-binding protein [Candidatus Roizmanbacteria bacterium]
MKELYIFSPSVVNQLQYPRKNYFIDTGFITALTTKFSKNYGRLFENYIYGLLSQQCETLHYYRDREGAEVDFVSLTNGRADTLYQVCYDLSDNDTVQREIKALLKAKETLKCNNAQLITLYSKPAIPILPEIEVITPEMFLK